MVKSKRGKQTKTKKQSKKRKKKGQKTKKAKVGKEKAMTKVTTSRYKINKVTKQQKYTKSLIATLLSVVAVIILLSQAAYVLMNSNLLTQKLEVQLKESGMSAQTLTNTFISLAIVWIILAIALIVSLIRVNKNEKRWTEVLIIGIITVISFRLLSGLLVIISSLVFKPFKPSPAIVKKR